MTYRAAVDRLSKKPVKKTEPRLSHKTAGYSRSRPAQSQLEPRGEQALRLKRQLAIAITRIFGRGVFAGRGAQRHRLQALLGERSDVWPPRASARSLSAALRVAATSAATHHLDPMGAVRCFAAIPRWSSTRTGPQQRGRGPGDLAASRERGNKDLLSS